MKLEEYFGSKIPKYAILSHCWGIREVTFQDINGPHWRQMTGAIKIELAAAYCYKNNYDYIWIDTCCIDKTSSAELLEAINSMCSWYEGADICYVYLEGVASDPNTVDTGADIRGSKWFKRGWTLQELIVPQRIASLDLEWNHLGTKQSLSNVIRYH